MRNELLESLIKHLEYINHELEGKDPALYPHLVEQQAHYRQMVESIAKADSQTQEVDLKRRQAYFKAKNAPKRKRLAALKRIRDNKRRVTQEPNQFE